MTPGFAPAVFASFALLAAGTPPGQPIGPGETQNPAPTAADWQAVARLPDWSGVWVPDVVDQNRQIKTNPPPWNAKAAALVAKREAQEKAGDPFGLFVNCLPHGMPALMLKSHNAIEFSVQPGRVLLLGDTLVVDTVGVLPETYIAVSEAVGVPNNGDLHVVERIHLTAPDTLAVDLTITAPKVLTAPWKTTRIFYRERGRTHEIVEGVCLQGSFVEDVDADGFAVFAPLPSGEGGTPAPGDTISSEAR